MAKDADVNGNMAQCMKPGLLVYVRQKSLFKLLIQFLSIFKVHT